MSSPITIDYKCCCEENPKSYYRLYRLTLLASQKKREEFMLEASKPDPQGGSWPEFYYRPIIDTMIDVFSFEEIDKFIQTVTTDDYSKNKLIRFSMKRAYQDDGADDEALILPWMTQGFITKYTLKCILRRQNLTKLHELIQKKECLSRDIWKRGLNKCIYDVSKPGSYEYVYKDAKREELLARFACAVCIEQNLGFSNEKSQEIWKEICARNF